MKTKEDGKRILFVGTVKEFRQWLASKANK